jgi:hypothetical protein
MMIYRGMVHVEDAGRRPMEILTPKFNLTDAS